MIIKLGETQEITVSDIIETSSILDDSMIMEKFATLTKDLKKIAPKADDFLYFSAIMMHSAEASLINSDGTPKLDKKGSPVKAYWEKKGESWKWVSSDPYIKPYKNSNGDIFPEEELVKAYQKWIGKPLCIDHKSSSVDAIRGLIVDTYYDRKLKRVIALCALDKVNYPDLARKVASGYATCVSMGTAVGKAVCSDCGQVAKTADDFCNHMRTKSCYGEINIDLQPIELSIVVNGADPQAKIKHIIASANNISKYIESKQNQLSKAASAKEIEVLENEIAELTGKVAKLKEDLVTASNEDNLKSSELAVENESSYVDNSSESNIKEKFALDATALEILNAINKNIEKLASKIDSIKEANSEKVSEKENSNLVNTASENNMTMKKESYFQGGGGVNEPAPGQSKYEKESLNEDLRNNGDRHMTGVADTGSVDGLYPGDQEKKEMLLRAEKEERALRRAAVLKEAKESLKAKEAYYQGAGKESDPTPGKQKYPVDPMNEKLRHEDKHMTGKKPFPNVGDVEGPLGGKEELAQKKLLQRASLKLRFNKVANQDGTINLGESAWEVYKDDEVVMSATVNEISGGNAEALYNVIATKEFGQKMLSTIKSAGLEKAKSIYKKAQVAPAPVEPAASPMPAASAPMPEEGKDQLDVAPDMGKDGDPKDSALALAEQVRDTSSDLVEAVKALTGEQTEVDSVQEMSLTASEETKALFTMRKELNAALSRGMSKAASELNKHESELRLINNILEEGSVDSSNQSFVNTIVNDAIQDAKSALADARRLMGAFVKYARGTEALVKRAEMESKLNKTASDLEGEAMESDSVDLDELLGDLDDSVLDQEVEGLDVVDDFETDEVDEGFETDDEVEELMANDGTVVELPPGASVPAGAKAVTASFDLSTKEGRAAYRAKLASDADFSDMLDEAHPQGGVTTKLDVKPSGDLAKVEDLEEVHSRMMDVAKAPPKVRKDAEQIQALVAEGKLDAENVDALVAHGVDADAVKYWKQFYGEVGKEGNQFAGELVKEHAKAKFEEELNAYKVKLARAYSLANDMVRRGIVADDGDAVTAQVEEIMKWNDEGFESVKKLVSKQAVKKTASVVPQVGVFSSDEAPKHSTDGDLYEELLRAFSTKKH